MYVIYSKIIKQNSDRVSVSFSSIYKVRVHEVSFKMTLNNLSHETTEGCIRYIFVDSVDMCNDKSMF